MSRLTARIVIGGAIQYCSYLQGTLTMARDETPPNPRPIRPSQLNDAFAIDQTKSNAPRGKPDESEGYLDLDADPSDAPPPNPAPMFSEAAAARLMPMFDAAPGSSPPMRDRIVILGRRRAGKTIFLARLYEALWQGCKVIDGRMLASGESSGGRKVVVMSCRTTSGPAHVQFMKIAEELRKGKWPAATSGNTYSEIVVSNGGREHVVTALDYPGEVFRKAFMLESDDPDAVELRMTVDRAAAAILLIDPSVAAGGGDEAQEDVFGLTHAALRIRKSIGGELVPIAIVFTKCDVNAAFLKEAGGVRKFASKHFGQLFREIERTSVFACAAVRVEQNSLGKQVPRAEKPPENIVEPLRYCLDFIERGTDVRRTQVARDQRTEAMRTAQVAETAERKKSAVVWVVFAVAVTMLLVASAAVAFWISMRK